MRNYRNSLIAVLFLCSINLIAAQDDGLVGFSYTGLVRVQGTAFDGEGMFKFAIVNNPGSVTLWSNDGTSVGGAEPATAIQAPVGNGIFNILLGDPEQGMEPIDRTIFRTPTRIKLRIWFSDGEHGFQRLLPDRRLLNVDLLALQSGLGDLVIYVSESTGNDDFNGLTTDTAKRTIQAAVDVIPQILNSNATIRVFPGTYRETVEIAGRIIAGAHELRLLGEPGSPESVIWSGEGAPGVHELERGVVVRNQQGVGIEGFRFEYFDVEGIRLENSNVRAENLIVRECLYGISVLNQSSLGAAGLDIGHGSSQSGDASQSSRGIFVRSNSRVSVSDSQFHNMVYGIESGVNSSLFTVENCEFADNAIGLHLSIASSAVVPSSIFKRNDVGIRLRLNSVLSGYYQLEFGTDADANGQDIQSLSNSVFE